MFDESLFTYDKANHRGFYRNRLIPSVTQLLEILFPISAEIPQERLENAAKRGTDIHLEIEMINDLLGEIVLEKDLIADRCQANESVCDYVSLMLAFDLKPLAYEETVFLLDDNDEPICYGHFDLIFGAKSDIAPFTKGDKFLADVKTTSVFDKNKTALQTAIYRVAWNKANPRYELKPQTYGIWVRDGAKLIPLKEQKDDYVIELCRNLRDLWVKRNGGIKTILDF